MELGEKERKPQDPPGDHMSWLAETVTVKIENRDDLRVRIDK